MDRLNREHYKEGKLYAFEITDVKQDINSMKPYYVIEDDFASHRYYFTGEQKYKLGEDCILEVVGFTNKGFLKLKEVERLVNHQVERPDGMSNNNYERQQTNYNWDKLPTLNVGEESETVEFKSSIVFPPDNNGEPNIDKQMKNIIKVLVAFMNTEGGVLYIGIHDRTKKILGIENDYEHLNESEYDEYAYQNSVDGYQLKIRNTMEKICTGVAGSMVHFSFKTVQGKTYCQVNVDSATRPVYIDGSKLYVRQGNRNKLLKDDEITLFVYNKMSISVKEIIDTDDLNINSNAFADLNKLEELLRKLVNTKNSALIPTELLPKKKLGEIDWWIIWQNDGSWVKQRNKSDKLNVAMQLPVYKELKDGLLAFCYDNGRVNVMKVSVFLRGVNANTLRKNGWARTGEQPKNVFLMHPTDFLIGYSVDSDGIQHVKLHSISDYTTTQSAVNEGSAFIPQNDKVLKYAVIGAEHKRKVKHLIVPKRERSNNAGPALTSPTIQDEIEYLKQVLEQE